MTLFDRIFTGVLTPCSGRVRWIGRRSNRSSHDQKQALCRACEQSVTVRYATAYWDLNAEAVIFEMAIRALAEGNSLRSTARIVQIDKDTTCD